MRVATWRGDTRFTLDEAPDPAAGRPCAGSRLVPVAANGSPAFWQYRDGKPFGLVVLTVRDNLITETTTFLDADQLVGLFTDEFRVAVP